MLKGPAFALLSEGAGLAHPPPLLAIPLSTSRRVGTVTGDCTGERDRPRPTVRQLPTDVQVALHGAPRGRPPMHDTVNPTLTGFGQRRHVSVLTCRLRWPYIGA